MLEPLIQYLRLFRDIPPGDIAVIQQELSYREVAEGTLLAREGNTCRELFFIIQGVLKIMVNNDKGDEVAHFFLKENQFCTILYSFNDQVPARESIYAACDATLAVFSRDRLLRLYEKLPYLQTLINQITQQALLEKIRIRAAYLGKDAATRYQQFLVLQPDIALRVPLGDIASYLGVTQQSLSRIRKSLR